MTDRKWFAEMARAWLRASHEAPAGSFREWDCRMVAAAWIKEGQTKFPKV